MTGLSTTCPTCGTPRSGKFCSNCGSSSEGADCPACGSVLSPGARFCSGCGRPAGSTRAAAQDRTPGIIAGGALAALLAVLLIMVIQRSPDPAAGQPPVANLTPASSSEAPPDISNLSPRERFNRLYNRVMRAAQVGDQATVTRFTPMALMAYAQLDSMDADSRYHAALLKVHTGQAEDSRALADTILAETPGHLFGYVIRGTVARFRKDETELKRAYAGFLKRYDAEMKLGRVEYGEHRTSLEEFRKAALAGGNPRGNGS